MPVLVPNNRYLPLQCLVLRNPEPLNPREDRAMAAGKRNRVASLKEIY